MKTRVKSAIIMIAIVLVALAGRLLYVGVFDILIGCMSVIGCLEISNIYKKMNKEHNQFVAGMFPIFFYIIMQLFILFRLDNLYFLLAELGLILLVLIVLFIYKLITNKKANSTIQNKVNINNSFKYISNTFLLILYPGLCFASLFLVNNFELITNISLKYLQISYIMLALCFMISSVCDTFAYIFGSKIKGPKLAPKISPNKTISGAIFGLLGGIIGALIVYGISYLIPVFNQALSLFNIQIWHFVILGLFGAIIGQIGDLFESWLKRLAGIKDTGNIFPGHGGMMDRVDALCFLNIFIFVFFIFLI